MEFAAVPGGPGDFPVGSSSQGGLSGRRPVVFLEVVLSLIVGVAAKRRIIS
jgi:hypothetical protein